MSKEISKQLAKCPFCGVDLKADGKNFYVHPVVGCLLDGIPIMNDTESIKRWNTRKPMQNIVEQLKEKSFPDFKKGYTCNGEELLYLSDAIEIVKEEGGI